MATETNRVVTELVIDSTGAVRSLGAYDIAMETAEQSTQSLATATQKLEALEKKAAASRQAGMRVFQNYGTSLRTVERGYLAARAAADPAFKIQQQYEKNIARIEAAVRHGVTVEEQAARDIAQLRQKQIIDINRVRDATMNLSRAQAVANDNAMRGISTANVAAQLSDVGVSAAMGQSPLQIALAQGSQLTAAFGTAGAAGAVKALGAAFVSLINPVSLVTVGLIAGTAALIQYFMATDEKAEEADTAIKAHEDSIRALKAAYGDAADGLQEYAAKSKVVADAMAISAGFQLKDELEAFTASLVDQGALIQVETEKIKARMQELTEQRAFTTRDPAATMAINTELAALQSQLEITATSALAAADKFAPFRNEILAFGETVKAGKPDFIALQEGISSIVAANPGNEQLARLNTEINGLIDKGVTFQSGMQANADAIKIVGDQARTSASDVSGFSRAVSELANIAVPALTDTERAQDALSKALDAAGKDFMLRKEALAEYAATMQRIRNEMAGALAPTPTERPSYTGIDRIDEATAAVEKGVEAARRGQDAWEGLRQVTDRTGETFGKVGKQAEDLAQDLRETLGDALVEVFSGGIRNAEDFFNFMARAGSSFGTVDANDMEAIFNDVIGDE